LQLRAVEALRRQPRWLCRLALRHGLVAALRLSGRALQAELPGSGLRGCRRGGDGKRHYRPCDQASHGFTSRIANPRDPNQRAIETFLAGNVIARAAQRSSAQRVPPPSGGDALRLGGELEPEPTVPSTWERSTHRDADVGSIAARHSAMFWKVHKTNGPPGVLRQMDLLPAIS
jgi:hypothetical protein